MKWSSAAILLMYFLLHACAVAQDQHEPLVKATVCAIAEDPHQFDGKRIQLRAYLWSDFRHFWLNEPWANSRQIGKTCDWLRAEFVNATNLIGSTAFGTFTGRLFLEPRLKVGPQPIRFLIERESGIRVLGLQSGAIRIPFFYDSSSRTFLRPE